MTTRVSLSQACYSQCPHHAAHASPQTTLNSHLRDTWAAGMTQQHTSFATITASHAPAPRGLIAISSLPAPADSSQIALDANYRLLARGLGRDPRELQVGKTLCKQHTFKPAVFSVDRRVSRPLTCWAIFRLRVIPCVCVLLSLENTDVCANPEVSKNHTTHSAHQMVDEQMMS